MGSAQRRASRQAGDGEHAEEDDDRARPQRGRTPRPGWRRSCRVRLGKILELLHALARTDPEPASPAQRHQRLPSAGSSIPAGSAEGSRKERIRLMRSLKRWALSRMSPRAADARRTATSEPVLHLHAAQPEHTHHQPGDDDRRAQVALPEHQAAHEPDSGHPKGHMYDQKPPVGDPRAGEEVRPEDHHGQLGEFRGLKGERSQRDPTGRPSLALGHPGDVDQQQRAQHETPGTTTDQQRSRR